MKPKTEALPPSHLARIREMGLCVISYRDVARKVQGNDAIKGEWLPRDIVGRDGKTVVIYREANKQYSIDGWEPWHDGLFGGRYPEIHSALAWVQRAVDIRAGRAKDFLGV